jgi:hypothetical protein
MRPHFARAISGAIAFDMRKGESRFTAMVARQASKLCSAIGLSRKPGKPAEHTRMVGAP